MLIFDTHCHYNLLGSKWQEELELAMQYGVKQSIVVGVDWPSSQKAVELAKQKKSFLFASIGIHPLSIPQELSASQWALWLQTEIQKLKRLYLKNKQFICAVGEIGLDFFHYKLNRDNQQFQLIKERQLILFEQQLELAKNLNLPVIIHSREQSKLTQNANHAIAIIGTIMQRHSRLKYLLHCFSWSKKEIRKIKNLNFYLGMAGNITYPNSNKLRDTLLDLPKSKLLLETDAPYLPPQDFRGQKCQPWMISKTAEFISQKLNLSLEQIYQNSFNFFQI